MVISNDFLTTSLDLKKNKRKRRRKINTRRLWKKKIKEETQDPHNGVF